MKRRDFLKLIGVASVAPTVLAAMPKKELTIEGTRKTFEKVLNWYMQKEMPVGIALEDTPEGEYGWFVLDTPVLYKGLQARYVK